MLRIVWSEQESDGASAAAEWLSVTSPRKQLLQRNLKLKRCLQGGNLRAKASDTRFSRETRIRRGGVGNLRKVFARSVNTIAQYLLVAIRAR